MLPSMTPVVSQTYLAPLLSDVEQVLRSPQILRSGQPRLPHPALFIWLSAQLFHHMAVSLQ